MQVEQQHRPPAVPHGFKRRTQNRMIRAMDKMDPVLKILGSQSPAPNLSRVRQAAGHQAQTATCPSIVAVPNGIFRHRSADHAPVHVVGRSVEIDDRTRHVRDHACRADTSCDRARHKIDEPVFQLHRDTVEISHGLHHVSTVDAPAVRRGDQQRDSAVFDATDRKRSDISPGVLQVRWPIAHPAGMNA